MKICVKCGNVFEGKFCNECGTPYSAEPEFQEAIILGAPDSAINQNDTDAAKSDSGFNSGESLKQKMSQEDIAELIAQLQQHYPHNKSQSATQTPVARVKIQKKFDNYNSSHNNILAKLLRYLPASLNLIFGAFILIFLTCPAFSTALGSLPGTTYDLIGKIENFQELGLLGASVGAIFLVISGVAYLCIGSLKLLWSVKYPHYKNRVLSIFSVALLFETFIMSCVMVGTINSVQFINSGASGALILTCSLIGGLIVISELILNLTGCLDFMKPLYADAARAHAQQSNSTNKDKAAPMQNQYSQSANNSLGTDKATATEMRYTSSSSASGVDYEKNEFPNKISITCRNGAKGFRWIPAITSIITAAVMALLSTLPIGPLNPLLVAIPFTLSVSLIGVISSILFFLLGVYRLFKAYSDPYEKRPIVTMIQAALLWVTATCSALNIIYWTRQDFMGDALHITSIMLTILCCLYLFCFVIGAIYQILVTKTYRRAAVIKEERNKLCRKPEQIKIKNKVVLIIMWVILVASAAIGPIVSVCLINNSSSLSNAYEKITIDLTEYEVIDILGEPYERTSNNLNYYSNNYVNLMNKILKCKNPKDMQRYKNELSTIKFDMLKVSLSDYVYCTDKITYYKQISPEQTEYRDTVEKATMDVYNDNYEVITQKGYREKGIYDSSRLRITEFGNGDLKALAETSFGDTEVVINTNHLANASEFTLEYEDKAATITFQRTRNNYSEFLAEVTYVNQYFEYDSSFMNSAEAIIEYLNDRNKYVKLVTANEDSKLFKDFAFYVNKLSLRDRRSGLTLDIDKYEGNQISIAPTGFVQFPIQDAFIDILEAALCNNSDKRIILTDFVNGLDSIMPYIDEFDINNSNYYGKGNSLFDISGITYRLVKYIANNSDTVIDLSNLPYSCAISKNCFVNVNNGVKINLAGNTVKSIDDYAFGDAGINRSYYIYTDSADLAINFNQRNLSGVKSVAIAEDLEVSLYIQQYFSFTGKTYYNGNTYNLYTY